MKFFTFPRAHWRVGRLLGQLLLLDCDWNYCSYQTLAMMELYSLFETDMARFETAMMGQDQGCGVVLGTYGTDSSDSYFMAKDVILIDLK